MLCEQTERYGIESGVAFTDAVRGPLECFAFRRLASTLLEVTTLGHRIRR